MNSKVMFMEVFETVINEKPKMLYNKYPSYKKKCYGVRLGLTESSVVVYFMNQKLVVKLGHK